MAVATAPKPSPKSKTKLKPLGSRVVIKALDPAVSGTLTIASNGKINSLSLIALGLGPKRDAVVKPPAPTPVDQ